MTEELTYVLRQLGLDIESVPHFNKMIGDKNKDIRKKALKSLSKSSYDALVQRYQDDFDAFGYEIPKYEKLGEFY